VRDPQWPSYRLSAEIRHDESHERGEVGLFVAHREYDTAKGALHHVLQLSFNDIQPGAPVALGPYVRMAGTAHALDLRMEGIRRTFGPGPGFRRTTWRKLVVEVTPTSVRGFWDGGQPIGELPVPAIVRQTADAVEQRLAQEPDRPLRQLILGGFAGRGGLGLFVFRGSAAFRSVVIEPDRRG
jgi:hypothetical protein